MAEHPNRAYGAGAYPREDSMSVMAQRRVLTTAKTENATSPVRHDAIANSPRNEPIDSDSHHRFLLSKRRQ